MTASGSESAAARAARHLDVSWQGERLERSLARVHERRGQRRAAVKAGLGLAALAAAAAAFFVLAPRDPGSPAIEQAAVAPPSAAPSPKTTFADGSVARVSEGGELVVKSATARRIEAVLAAGAADFEVSKHPEREFVVMAGELRVRVVGTRFRVERSGERTRVAVAEGKVEVQEGSARFLLEAGESRFFPSAEAAAPAPPPKAGAGVGARARFLELARGGEFKAAYQVMSQSPGAVGGSAEDLLLAADAARLSNHPEQAVGFLRRVTSEHARDSRAPLAAFTLGRVLLSQLGRPAEAADAFAQARRLRPAGGLAEDALAREAEARAASGAAARARALATEYLTRFPRGKHAATMQRLSDGQ